MNDGATSLFIASQYGHLDVVRELLDNDANIEAAYNNGYTPLLQASFMGHIHVVRALLDAGANNRHVANNGATARSVAGTNSRKKILHLLPAP